MKKYTNESSAGRARAQSYLRGPEKMPDGGEMTMQPAQRVDPSVRLGDIKGAILGDVPMDVQMAKPQAYQPKKGT